MRLILHTLFVFSAREPFQLSLTYSYLLGTKVTLSAKKKTVICFDVYWIVLQFVSNVKIRAALVSAWH